MNLRLHAIVLAAGAGRRFGGAKLLARWDHGTVLHAALTTAFAAPVESVILVTGFGAEPVAAAARAFAEAQADSAPLRIVHAPDHAEGMAGSIRAGVTALPNDADGLFLFLGDMPRVPASVLPRLAERLTPPIEAVAPVCRGVRGHPVLFGRALFSDLLALSGDRGAKALLDRLGPRLALVETEDDGILFDVDTAADLGRVAAATNPPIDG